MKMQVLPFLALMALASCGGPAVVGGSDSGTDSGTDGGISSDGTLPPGTDSPSASRGIVRYEAQDDSGNGYATGFTYNKTDDTFLVDNLAFDGADTPYTRGTKVSSLGRFAVYEGPDLYPDDVTGVPIGQFTHRALYAVSDSGNVELAIVRTGAYVNYGFGGFIYQRNGSVTLPTSGQAAYSGEYAGLRDFEGRAGLEYVRGDMTMAIDFEDFNDGNAVRASVTNRRVYDIDGNDITTDIMSAMGSTASVLPTITFDVGPGVMTSNGEIAGQAHSYTADASGAITTFESGNYYAIVSGDNAEEVVGIIVVTATDPRGAYTTRETGGFLLTRP
ncbi:MAG: hypothetical protein AB7U46_05095 [Paenirhodobacter sp.]|uniref:hypothetical protein n=1 Tax=Paenirhodobacter sp. TaxID=1965326 RepID=UPI003D0D2C98